MARQTFNAGHVVTAVEMNLMGAQSAQIFATGAARTAAYVGTTPVNGQVSVLLNTGKIYAYLSGGWVEFLPPGAVNAIRSSASTSLRWLPPLIPSEQPLAGVWDLQTIQAMRAAFKWPGTTQPISGGIVNEQDGHTTHRLTTGQTLTVARDVTAQIVVVADGGDGTATRGGGGGGLVTDIIAMRTGEAWQAVRADAYSASDNGTDWTFKPTTQQGLKRRFVALGGGDGSPSRGGDGGGLKGFRMYADYLITNVTPLNNEHVADSNLQGYLGHVNGGGGGYTAAATSGQGGAGLALNWGEGSIELSAGGSSTGTPKTGYGCGANYNGTGRQGTVLIRYSSPGTMFTPWVIPIPV